MKIKASTLALLTAAVVLGGVVVYVQSQGAPDAETSTAQKLFPFEEKQVQSFSLKTPERSLAFQKNAEGAWQMTEPERVAASNASVAYLLNLLGTGTSDRTLTVPATDQQTYGFTQPRATVEVTLDNGQKHRLVIGGSNFDRTAVYAQVDPPTTLGQSLKVSLVSMDFENAIARPLEEWKATTISSPTPTATPLASPAPGPTTSPLTSPAPSPVPTTSPAVSPTPSPTPAPTSPTPTPTGSPLVSPTPSPSPSP